MNIEKLKLFIAVAESLSFTKASEEMHLSQSNVSRYISELEKTLETELFERTTRSVSLTPTGNLFFAEAKQILQSYKSIVDRVTNLGKGLSGSLTVGFIDVFTHNILPGAVRSFRKKYPLVDFRLVEIASKEAESAVMKGRIDLGFYIYVCNETMDYRVKNHHVQKGNLDLVVSDGHQLANQKIISFDKLANEKILTYDREVAPVLYDTVTSLCRANNFTPDLDNSHTKASTIMLMVECGLGVAIVSSLTSSLYTPSKKLKTLKIEGVDMPSYLDLIWHRDDSNPCLYNFVKEVGASIESNMEKI